MQSLYLIKRAEEEGNGWGAFYDNFKNKVKESYKNNPKLWNTAIGAGTGLVAGGTLGGLLGGRTGAILGGTLLSTGGAYAGYNHGEDFKAWIKDMFKSQNQTPGGATDQERQQQQQYEQQQEEQLWQQEMQDKEQWWQQYEQQMDMESEYAKEREIAAREEEARIEAEAAAQRIEQDRYNAMQEQHANHMAAGEYANAMAEEEAAAFKAQQQAKARAARSPMGRQKELAEQLKAGGRALQQLEYAKLKAENARRHLQENRGNLAQAESEVNGFSPESIRVYNEALANQQELESTNARAQAEYGQAQSSVRAAQLGIELANVNKQLAQLHNYTKELRNNPNASPEVKQRILDQIRVLTRKKLELQRMQLR